MSRTWFILILSLIITGCQKSEEPQLDQGGFLLQNISPQTSGIDFSNSISEDPQHNILNYIYYYNGGGIAIGDINNDQLPDLYFVSNMGANRLYLNKGNLKFEDITKQAGVEGSASWNTGATMVDINGDGLLDIYTSAVSGLLDFEGHNELFINNGDGSFTERSREYGLDFKGFSTQAYFFDYDKDEDLDVYIVNHAVHTTLSHGPANVRNQRKPLVGDVLLNNQDGKFSDVSKEAGIYGGVNGYGLSASISDFNNDGWDDIYVCNDFHEDDYYYINNGDGSFREELGKAFSTISRFSMGSDAADLNADGYPDLVTLDMLPSDEKVIKESEGDDAMYNMQKRLAKLGYKDQYARNMLQINKMGEYFQETAIYNKMEATDWSWGPLIADFNNDGHQDLFIANGILRRPNDLDFKNYVSNAFKDRSQSEGIKWLFQAKDHMPEGKVPNEIFQGNSSRLKNRTGDWIEEKASFSNGAAYADLDLDGDLDLVINNLNQPAALYENKTTGSNFIGLKLKFKNGNLNGIGSRVILYSEDIIQSKQLFNSRGFLSAVPNQLHFGLDNNTKLDSIKVVWPDNTSQTLREPKVNQYHTIAYSDVVKEHDFFEKPSEIFKLKQNAPKLVHKEDNYDDFFYEKLIPYRVSTIGPAVAKGDIDGNGYEDIFIGNSSGEKAGLLLNDGKSLSMSPDEAIAKDYLYEDNDAEFFDADADGDLDLYVASGIHKIGIKSMGNDRFYVNNNGKFEKTRNQIPQNFFNASTVKAADYDADGDQDLFVGNLSEVGNFGKAVPSYLLKNDGAGNFSIDNDFKLEAHVSSATWEDLNGDNYPELVVTSEWDDPKIYQNKSGKLELQQLPQNMKGLWQAVSMFDIDKDGDKDILLGNWGQNTRFSASAESPLRMYHGDLNRDGKFETVVAYKRGTDYYPINSRAELIAQMNFISKKFPSHREFSLKSMEDIFGKEAISQSRIYMLDNLNSGYLENDNNSFTKFVPFEKAFQLSPVRSFEEIVFGDAPAILVSGNLMGVNTYHGGYSSLKGLLLRSNNDHQEVTSLGMQPMNQQIKATKGLKMENENLILVIPNNGEVTTYSYQPE